MNPNEPPNTDHGDSAGAPRAIAPVSDGAEASEDNPEPQAAPERDEARERGAGGMAILPAPHPLRFLG